MLGADLDLLQLAQGAQPHVEDRLGLHVGELEPRDQLGLGLVLIADDADHLIEVEIGDQIAAEHLEPVVDLPEAMLGAPLQHHLAMLQPFGQRLGKPHHHRHLAAAEHVHVERNAHFQLGQAEELLHENGGIDGPGARLQHQAHILGGFVAHIGEEGQLLGLHQLGDLFHQPRFLHEIGNLGDDDLVGAAPGLFLGPARAQAEAAAAGAIGLDDRGAVLHDNAAGREIGAGHEGDELLGCRARMVDQIERGVAQLLGIVRRDRGRHAHGNARRAVGEQVRERRREDDRLLLGAVIGLAKIDRVLVDPVEQARCDPGKLGLGISHGGGVIAVDIAEIALAVDQRIAHREILGEAHQRVVDRLVAMGVILTDDVADDAGAFLEAALRIEPELQHGVEQPAMHGFEAIAHIGQRPVHDGGEGVSEIALLERRLQRDGLDGRGFENRLVSHARTLSRF